MYIAVFALLGMMLLQWQAQSLGLAQGLAERDVAGERGKLGHAIDEVNAYRTFAFVAQAVMRAQPFTGSDVSTRTWADLRAHPVLGGAGSPFAQTVMPDGWRLRGNAGAWVICAPLRSAHSLNGLMASLPPENHHALQVRPGGQGGSTFVQIGQTQVNNDWIQWCAT